MGCYGCFWYISRVYWDLVIHTDKVKLRENSCIMDSCGKVLNMWYGVSVRYSDMVQSSVTTAGSLVSRKFLQHLV